MKKRLRFEVEEMIGLVLTALAALFLFDIGCKILDKKGFWYAAWAFVGLAHFAIFHVGIWWSALANERHVEPGARLSKPMKLLVWLKDASVWLMLSAFLGGAVAAYFDG